MTSLFWDLKPGSVFLSSKKDRVAYSQVVRRSAGWFSFAASAVRVPPDNVLPPLISLCLGLRGVTVPVEWKERQRPSFSMFSWQPCSFINMAAGTEQFITEQCDVLGVHGTL